jgi:hypothetical protein
MLNSSKLEFNNCEANLRSVLSKPERSFDIDGDVSNPDSIGSVYIRIRAPGDENINKKRKKMHVFKSWMFCLEDRRLFLKLEEIYYNFVYG